MKTISALLFACCFTLTALGQQLTLNGALMTDEKAPVPATGISVHGIGNTTDSKGQFKIVLPGDFSEGERVIIKVNKPGWAINHPLDGEWDLPNIKLQNIQTLDVIIVPKTSKALWTHKRIETFIARLSDDYTRQMRLLSAELAQAGIANARLREEARPAADFSEYLNRWAREFGQTPEQVRTAFDEWVMATENSDDYRTLGLRQFYLKNFTAAADHFVRAALRGEERIKRGEERLEKDQLETYEDWKLAGNAQHNAYNFREAINSYDRAVKFVAKEKRPQEWAEIEVLSGNARQELGVRAEGEEGVRLLAEAVTAYRNALLVYTREQLPQQWATTQNNLGRAYFQLKTWDKAAECYANVLTLYPGYKEGYQRSGSIYHEKLFEYAKAFELHRKWLESSPDDLSALTDFAETHFTTGRFAECERRIAALLVTSGVETTAIALRAIEIGNLLALDKASSIPAKIDTLLEAVARQPADFQVEWSFDGTLHFIGQCEKLAPYRDWLRRLFNAVKAENRDAIVKAVQEAKAGFKWQ